MRILDRYILSSVVKLLASCLFAFLLLYCLVDTFSFLEDVLKQHTPFILLVTYYLYYLPIVFVEITPFSFLLAVLYTFGKYNRDNEVIAMRASGLSIRQITRTVLVLAALLSVGIYYLNGYMVPRALQKTIALKSQLIGREVKEAMKSHGTVQNLCLYGQKNRLYFINSFSLDTNSMEGITILEQDQNQNLIRKIIAVRGEYREGAWHYFQVNTFNFDLSGQIAGEPEYLNEEIMDIPETPREFFTQRQHSEQMTLPELKRYIRKLSTSGALGAIRRLEVDYYHKMTKPLQTFLMAVLAIPFALMMRKRATGLSSLGIAIVMGFVYYVANAISVALGYAGLIPPVFSALIAHASALVASLTLLSHIP